MKLDMRTYFLQYLNGRGPTLEPYVVAVLVQLICRMTKLGWFEDSAYRSIVEDAGAFLEPRSNVSRGLCRRGSSLGLAVLVVGQKGCQKQSLH